MAISASNAAIASSAAADGSSSSGPGSSSEPEASQSSPASHGRSRHFHAPLYVSFGMLYAARTGRRENDPAALAQARAARALELSRGVNPADAPVRWGPRRSGPLQRPPPIPKLIAATGHAMLG